MCKQLISSLVSVGGWIRARQAQAPVVSRPEDLAAYIDRRPGAVHGEVDAAVLHTAPPVRAGFLERYLDPQHPLRMIQRFSFRSPTESPHPENNICYGVKWYGEGRERPAAAVVMLHGAFVPTLFAERVLSVPLLSRGVHVYALTAPYHMRRAPKSSSYSGQYMLSGDVPRLIEGLVQAAAEVRALVRALRRDGYKTILLFGTSMGGNIAGQCLTMSDADGGFLLIPAVDFQSVVEHAPLTRGVRRACRAAGFSVEHAARAMEAVTPHRLGLPRCGAERVRILYGLQDRQVPPETVERLIEAWPGVSATAWNESHSSMAVSLLRIRRVLDEWCASLLDGT